MSTRHPFRIPKMQASKRALLGVQMLQKFGIGEPIAVIGMACRYPGAPSPRAFWELLTAGRTTMREIPESRWKVDDYYSPAPGVAGKMNHRVGSFLEDVESFDCGFFGMTPRECRSLDPQQRLLLEVVWEALDNSGQRPDRLAESATGVFVGACRNDYGQIHGMVEHPERLDPWFGTGNALSFLAGRVSYLLGLRGPSLTIDTACSSSMTAVHLACQSLRACESRLAIAGGVNVILAPVVDVYMSMVGAISKDGKCRPFDERADGYVRGEGCGVVVLKLLSDAVRDGDTILGLIRGSAVNHDGKSNGLTAPSGPAQEAVIRAALDASGVHPAEVSFVETHGAGTALGDPIEAGALAKVFGHCERRQRLLLSSVKANIGHAEAAAGVAGLIKAILSLQARELPGQIEVTVPSTRIDWSGGNLRVDARRNRWEQDGQSLIAGVSSLGLSGTNAHLVLEEAPEPDQNGEESERCCLLPLSARSGEALSQVVEDWQQFLERTENRVCEIAATASRRRSLHPWRIAVPGASKRQLKERLKAIAGSDRFRAASGSGLAWVFSGYGAQTPGMGIELYRNSEVFRKAASDISIELEAAGWRRSDLFSNPLSEAELADAAVSQPATFALQYCLSQMWLAYGIRPNWVAGHSMGEVAAAVVAGALSVAEGALVIVERSRLLAQCTADGGMVSVNGSVDEVKKRLAGWEQSLNIAALNSPMNCVVAGFRGELERWLALHSDGALTFKYLRTARVAGHSPCVEGFDVELEQRLKSLQPRKCSTKFLSTVDGIPVDGVALDASYWARNFRQPVRFSDAVAGLLNQNVLTFLEIGPHPVLASGIHGNVEALRGTVQVSVMHSLNRDQPESETILENAGRLWTLGFDLDWTQVNPGEFRNVELPSYPWQRQRFWIERGTEETRSPSTRRVMAENELAATDRKRVRAIVERWAVEGTKAINRSLMAPSVFLTRDGEALFFVRESPSEVIGLFYVGPPSHYANAAFELLQVSRESKKDVSILATSDVLDWLRPLNLSTTPIGVLQTLPELREVVLEGSRMRRLRYQVKRYAEDSDCRTIEVVTGADSEVDKKVEATVRAWAKHRKKADGVARSLISLLRRADASDQRVFAARRRDSIDAVVVLSANAAKDGYLLDLEFYGPDVPAGCVEWLTMEVVAVLRREGVTHLSLGGTFGTQLREHPDCDPEVMAAFRQLYSANVLNGDSNYQFKSKFRPHEKTLFLCRPKDSRASLAGFLAALSGQETTSLENIWIGDRLAIASDDAIVFESKFSVDRHEVLKEHVVGGKVVVPGALYLVMAEGVARKGFDAGAVELTDFAIQAPMVLDEGERSVQAILTRQNSGDWNLKIASKSDSENDWTIHALARAQSTPSECRIRTLPVDGKLDEAIAVDDLYSELRKRGVELGAAFRLVRDIRTNGQHRIANISNPFGQALHPAVLDACFQSLADFGGQRGNGATYLLRGADSIAIFHPLSADLVCVSSFEARSGSSGALFADLELLDEDGLLLVAIKGLCAMPVNAAKREETDWTYEIAWEEKSGNVDSNAGTANRTLVVSFAPGLAPAGSTESTNTGVKWLDVSTAAGETATEQCRRVRDLVALRLDNHAGEWDRIWVVTESACYVDTQDNPNPENAALWGLGRVLALEHPESWGGLIDTAAGEGVPETRRLIERHIENAPDEDQCAIRHGKVFAARIRRLPLLREGKALRSPGTIIVTGGCGGLGFEAAKEIAKQGSAIRLILAGRSDIASAREKLNVLRGLGVEAEYMQADVRDASQVELLVNAGNIRGDLRGIIHSVGVIRDSLLVRQDWGQFNEVFEAKAIGARHLHEKSKHLELDHFVLFSSVASVLGSPAQGAHAAANAYLDALAGHRVHLGLQGLSVNWGPWSEVGMAALTGVENRLAPAGVASISPADGAKMAASLLGSKHSQIVALTVNWARWNEFFGADQPRLFEKLSTPTSAGVSVEKVHDARRGTTAIEVMSKATGLPESHFTSDASLESLGVDSIMVVEIRDKLERATGRRIPLSLFFKNPSVADIQRAIDGGGAGGGAEGNQAGHSTNTTGIRSEAVVA